MSQLRDLKSQQQKRIDAEKKALAIEDRLRYALKDRLDITAKDDTIWERLEIGEKTRIRPRVPKFTQRTGPTLFALSRIDHTALSSFRLLISDQMLNHISECSNEQIVNWENMCEAAAASSGKPFRCTRFRVTRLDLLAFIAVTLCRGLYCGGVAFERLW